MKRLIIALCLACAACASGKPQPTGNAAASGQSVQVEVHTSYFQMNGKRYNGADDLAAAARKLPSDASVLIKSSLNGTTAQSRKVLDDKTAVAVAALQKAGLKHIMIKQAFVLRS